MMSIRFDILAQMFAPDYFTPLLAVLIAAIAIPIVLAMIGLLRLATSIYYKRTERSAFDRHDRL